MNRTGLFVLFTASAGGVLATDAYLSRLVTPAGRPLPGSVESSPPEPTRADDVAKGPSDSGLTARATGPAPAATTLPTVIIASSPPPVVVTPPRATGQTLATHGGAPHAVDLGAMRCGPWTPLALGPITQRVRYCE